MVESQNNRFSRQQVFDSLNYGFTANDSQSDINVRLIDKNSQAVIGLDSDGFVIFGARQVSNFSGYSFPRAKLEANREISLTTGERIEPAFILRFLAEDAEELTSIATIFAGLQNQILDEGDSRGAQTAAKGFEDFFRGVQRIHLGREVEIGLFGELCFIYSSSDPNLMVQAWHSSPMSTYDFGLQDSRLEVKTSVSPTRLHWLRSTQSLELDRNRLKYLSIYAPEVPDGLGILELKVLIDEKLSSENSAAFNEKIGLYDISKTRLRFDLLATLESFRFIDGMRLPIVTSHDPAIREIRWQCSFTEVPSSVSSDPWFAV